MTWVGFFTDHVIFKSVTIFDVTYYNNLHCKSLGKVATNLVLLGNDEERQ